MCGAAPALLLSPVPDATLAGVTGDEQRREMAEDAHFPPEITAPSTCDVFLGGACGETTWRKDVAIPLLEQAGVSYWNPQVSAAWARAASDPNNTLLACTRRMTGTPASSRRRTQQRREIRLLPLPLRVVSPHTRHALQRARSRGLAQCAHLARWPFTTSLASRQPRACFSSSSTAPHEVSRRWLRPPSTSRVASGGSPWCALAFAAPLSLSSPQQFTKFHGEHR